MAAERRLAWPAGSCAGVLQCIVTCGQTALLQICTFTPQGTRALASALGWRSAGGSGALSCRVGGSRDPGSSDLPLGV